jgi:hypothetical protein
VKEGRANEAREECREECKEDVMDGVLGKKGEKKDKLSE